MSRTHGVVSIENAVLRIVPIESKKKSNLIGFMKYL